MTSPIDRIQQEFLAEAHELVEALSRSERSLAARVSPPESRDRYVPSVDALFDSASRVMGDKAIALLLTGMGDDGAQGAGSVKRSRRSRDRSVELERRRERDARSRGTGGCSR